MTPDLILYKEFAIGLTTRAGMMLMSSFSDHIKMHVSKKDRHEVVTKNDIAIHKFMQKEITQRFPEHNFMSEEGEMIDNGSSYTWVIDPLDGTLNYTIGNPFFATSLTILFEQKPILAVTYAPFLQEMFIAEKGKPARLNERIIKPSAEKKLSNAVLSFGFFAQQANKRAKSLQTWCAIDDQCRAMRHLGCTSLELAYVACGRMEGVILSPPLRLWDVSAGTLLVECAGGAVTNFDGQSWNDTSQGLIVSNTNLNTKIVQLIQTSCTI